MTGTIDEISERLGEISAGLRALDAKIGVLTDTQRGKDELIHAEFRTIKHDQRGIEQNQIIAGEDRKRVSDQLGAINARIGGIETHLGALDQARWKALGAIVAVTTLVSLILTPLLNLVSLHWR
jgi:hypothetical protein